MGELDEEMVYEARPGQTFLLGASTWRIEEITRDRVIVTPAPGAPGAVPFWKGESVGRPKELGEAIGAFSREAVDRDPAELAAEYDLDERAARNLSTYLREQRDATRVVPSDRTVVVERFRDEIGDWRLCVLSPFGGRVHAAWALALSARIRDDFGLESDAIWSDDGIIVHLPDADEPPSADLVMVEPDAIEELVVRELSGSALFGARFRENAARALLLPRAYPGRRTPLWQQRLKAQSLLEVAKRYGQFPIVLETYRECLRDVLDLPGLEELLRGLHTRELSLVEVETQRASPFASSLLFDYVATYMYEGDTPNAERRAAALALDRDLLRELLGQEELRELIDPAALDEVEADLQRAQRADARRELGRAPRRAARARRPDGGRGPGALARGGVRQADARRARAPAPRRPDADRRRGALDRVRGRRPLPGRARRRAAREACPTPSWRRWRSRSPGWPAATRAPTGPSRPRDLRRAATAVDMGPVLRELEQADRLIRGELRPGGSEREWCDTDVLRRLRRASLASLRTRGGARRAAGAGTASCRPGRAWTRRPGGRRRRGPAARAARAAPGAGAGARGLGARRARPGAPGATPRPGSTSSARAASSSGWARGRSGAARAGWRSTSATTRAGSARRTLKGDPPAEPLHEAIRARLGARAPPSGPTCWPTSARPSRVELQEALWDLVWAGEVTNDAFAPLRAPRLTLARRERDGGPPLRATAPPGRAAGAGTLVAHRAAVRGPARRTGRACAPWPRCCSSATGSSRARRCSPRGSPAASRRSTASSRTSRRWARRGAATSSRGSAAPSSPCPPRSSGCAACAPTSRPAPQVLAATDPANPYGATLPWPRRDDDSARRPSRVPGAYVVTLDAEPVLYVERGGKGLVPLREPDEAWLRPAHGGAGRRGAARPRRTPGRGALRRRAGGGIAGRASC